MCYQRLSSVHHVCMLVAAYQLLLICFIVSPTLQAKDMEWTVEMLRKAMLAERERFRSGEALGTGFERYVDEADGKIMSREGPSTFRVVFDAASNVFFFDHTGVKKYENGKGKRNIYAVLPDRSLHLSADRPDAFIIAAPQDKEVIHPYEVKSFDPRALGMLQVSSLMEGLNLREAEKDLFRASISWEIASASDSEGMLVLDEKNSHNIRRTRLWIDVANGMTIVKRVHDRGVYGDRYEFVANIVEEAIQWKQIAGVYLPIKYVSKAAYPYLARQPDGREVEGVHRYEKNFQFDWSRINQPVSPQEFDYRSLGLADGTNIFDKRLGSMQAFDIIRGEKMIVEEKERLSVHRLLFYVFAAIAVVACVYAFYRKYTDSV